MTYSTKKNKIWLVLWPIDNYTLFKGAEAECVIKKKIKKNIMLRFTVTIFL